MSVHDWLTLAQTFGLPVTILIAGIAAILRGWVVTAASHREVLAEKDKQIDLYKQLTDNLTAQFTRSLDLYEALEKRQGSEMRERTRERNRE